MTLIFFGRNLLFIVLKKFTGRGEFFFTKSQLGVTTTAHIMTILIMTILITTILITTILITAVT